jgi:hypothetical protein
MDRFQDGNAQLTDLSLHALLFLQHLLQLSASGVVCSLALSLRQRQLGLERCGCLRLRARAQVMSRCACNFLGTATQYQ